MTRISVALSEAKGLVRGKSVPAVKASNGIGTMLRCAQHDG